MNDVALFLLIILIAICLYRIHWISKVVRENQKKSPASEPLPPPQRPVVPPPLPVVPPIAAVSAPPPPDLSASCIGGETVATVSAAIALVMDEPHTITGIAPAPTHESDTFAAIAAAAAAVAAMPASKKRRRPVWGFAGVQQNTRPFQQIR